MAANSLHHAKYDLGEFFRRITRKLGKPQAITCDSSKRYVLKSLKLIFGRCLSGIAGTVRVGVI
jgi:hypothetical protein